MTPSIIFRNAKRALVALFAVSAILPTSACVSRRQYAINEAILISERRQLEDEIYRVQFELRDALEENERLRERLEKDEDEPKTPAKRSTNASTRRAQKSGSSSSSFFPGGSLLDVDVSRPTRPQDPDEYDDSVHQEDYDESGVPTNAETLPDFVPIPASRAATSRRQSTLSSANYLRSNAGAQRASVGQASYVDDPNADADYDYDEAASSDDDGDEDWSPVAAFPPKIDRSPLLNSPTA